MKTWKLQLSLIAAIITLATTPYAHAAPFVLDGTYTFYSTDGDTALDGSWVTFSGDTIVNWYMNDPFALSPPPTDIPLTPSNSFIANFGVFGPNQWFFVIDGNNIGTNYYDEFKGQNNLFGPGPGGGTGALYDGFGDPTGNWRFAAASVPDSGNTFALLGAALIALVSVRRLLRRPALARN